MIKQYKLKSVHYLSQEIIFFDLWPGNEVNGLEGQVNNINSTIVF
jgi:hypothetical protein